jgi:hypothetical protein
MSVRGVFASHSSIVGDRQNTLSGRILKTGWAGTLPLLALSAGMKEEKVTDTNWSWIEDTHVSGNGKVVSAANSSVTSLTVADTSIWTNRSILLVETTGEYLLVTAVPTATTVTVRRGFAGTTAATIAANATLQIIGTAHEEGGGKPDAVMTFGDSYTNFVQIFKQGWSITGTAKAVSYVTGSKLAESKAQATAFHAENLERSFLFGRKSLTKLDGKELRTSNGIIPQIETYGGIVESANYGSVAGAMSTAGIQDFMRRIFDKNAKGLPNERISLTSSLVLNLIQAMVRKDTRYDLTLADKAYGLDIWKMSFVGNDLKLAVHPLMSENPYWAKELYVLHPGLIKKRVLRPTWTQEFSAGTNTNNGVDADEGFIADELGWELKGAPLHGIMRNITSAVASD